MPQTCASGKGEKVKRPAGSLEFLYKGGDRPNDQDADIAYLDVYAL